MGIDLGAYADKLGDALGTRITGAADNAFDDLLGRVSGNRKPAAPAAAAPVQAAAAVATGTAPAASLPPWALPLGVTLLVLIVGGITYKAVAD